MASSAGWAYWAIEMNELCASVLKVMESSSLGRMSKYVLSKQSMDLGIDLEELSHRDLGKLSEQLRSVLPFFLGEETDRVVSQIRRLGNNRKGGRT